LPPTMSERETDTTGRDDGHGGLPPSAVASVLDGIDPDELGDDWMERVASEVREWQEGQERER